jgi:hypothetical protein
MRPWIMLEDNTKVDVKEIKCVKEFSFRIVSNDRTLCIKRWTYRSIKLGNILIN